MSSLNRVSTLVNSQLPEFIRSDYPAFAEFIEKYFEFLEQPGNPVYELKTFQNNYDTDLTREGLLKYFRTKILPSFPEESQLSTERIIKAARDFYLKKGTPDSFKFLFRVLYNKDLDIYFPKLQIFKASDGKWVQPQAFRLTSSPANQSVNIELLKSQKGTGLVSRATCIVERVYKTFDAATNAEIYEVYVSSISRTFNNNEILEIPYVDENGVSQTFQETIIGSLSNIKINPKRRGRRYLTGDPVVISGGQNLNSLTRQKAIATVGNVTVSVLDTVTVVKNGYGFRTTPNTYVDIITRNPSTGLYDGTGNGSGANVIVSSVDTANAVKLSFSSDAISLKANSYLYENDLDFSNSSPTVLFYADPSGSTQTNINLASRPSVNTTNGYYNNYVLKVTSGTGSNGQGAQINTVVINDYYGSNTIATVNANTSIVGTVNISGINVVANSSYKNKADFTAGVPGFYTYLTAGKDIEINGEIRTIATVTNSEHLTVTVPFSAPANDKKLNANSTLTTALDNSSYLQLTTSLDSRVGGALTFETLNLYPIQTAAVVTGGGGFDQEPPATFNVVSLYDSDLSTFGNVLLTAGDFYTYNNVNASFKLSFDFSSVDDFYVGRRIKLDNHYRTIIDYDGATRTVFLERPFETNITPLNILSKVIRLDNRPTINYMGIIGAVEIINGGTGYANNDPIYFYGTGYGAAANVTSVGAGGVIKKITFTNRGEGYPTPPTVVAGGSGNGANLKAVLLGDGEELTATTTDRGEIIDIVLSNRGSDYISKPNVSLKIYDLYVTGNTTNIASIKENDIIYQGTPSNKFFTGIVDGLYLSNTILRVFDYSGTPNVANGNVIITRANTTGIYVNVHNTGVVFANANIDGKIYPLQYGNGRAKANAEFLNGLIRFNGFYLNSDGHVSADKRLQDDDRYHNYSYSLLSEESYDTYKKTIFDTVHPTGTKLLPIHVIPELNPSGPEVRFNTHSVVLTSNVYIANCSISYDSNNVVGGVEYFDFLANVGDIIVINSENVYRSFAKTITSISSNNSLNIESSCVIVGEGRAHISSGNASIVIKGNSNIISRFITTNDRIRLNIDGSTLIKSINSIFGNVVTLNSNAGITNTTNLTIDTTNARNYGKETVPALVYEVIPAFNNVEYQIIRT